MRARILGRLPPRARKALGGQNGCHGSKVDRASRCRHLAWPPLRPGTKCLPTRQASTCSRDDQCFTDQPVDLPAAPARRPATQRALDVTGFVYPCRNAAVRQASDAANPMPRNPAFHINMLHVVLARAGDFASDRAGDFSLSEGAIGGDARAPPAAMICCCQASPSAIMRSNAPRAQSWYACIRSTIVSVLHMRSEHSDADLVPVWRRSNQLFENVCILFKNLS